MRTSTTLLSAAALLLMSRHAYAWHEEGHRRVASLAPQFAAGKLPAFFAEDKGLLASSASDPDLFRESAPTELRNGESPEHYFDLELLGGQPLPSNRYACIAFCAAKGIVPADIGLLPYAVTEWTERLTVVLAEHRKWPDNPRVRAKCLLYAGILSHYAADLTQPLHVTVDYDGRAGADGKSPKTGIHNRVDALLGKAGGPDRDVIARLKAAPFQDVFPAVVKELERSHKLVGKVYALEGVLPAAEDPLGNDTALNALVRDRLRAAALFTASLYLTAWDKSESYALPPWHQEPK